MVVSCSWHVRFWLLMFDVLESKDGKEPRRHEPHLTAYLSVSGVEGDWGIGGLGD